MLSVNPSLYPSLVVSRWVRFPKRTHRKTAPSRVLTLYQANGYKQKTTGKRWGRLVEWHISFVPIFHKSHFKGTQSPRRVQQRRGLGEGESHCQRTVRTISISRH